MYNKDWQDGEFQRVYMWFGNEDYDQGTSEQQSEDDQCYFAVG